MSRVPVITSACPLRWSSAPKPGQDFCGQCQRQVHNLDLMSASERETFLSGCSGEVCVSYTVRRPVRATIALSTLAAVAALGGAAAAQDQEVIVSPDSPYCPTEDLVEVFIGGTQAGEKLQWVDEAELARPDKPDLPEIATADWLPTPKT
jgi:hypothetical protein